MWGIKWKGSISIFETDLASDIRWNIGEIGHKMCDPKSETGLILKT